MFRPCIDLHEGKVKQIVGGSLGNDPQRLQTNFVSGRSAAWYAQLYRQDALRGGHVIMLGPGNEGEARAALGAYPGGLQIGGGITVENARGWLEAGASHVIVTSWIFQHNQLDWDRLQQLKARVGKERLVLDLSCRKREGDYFIVTDRWQKFTNLVLNQAILRELSACCSEFLVHAVDVEGLRAGIDETLVRRLGEWTSVPTTYAGGASSLADLATVQTLGKGRIDLTIGSALDIFGGNLSYREVVALAHRQKLLPDP